MNKNKITLYTDTLLDVLTLLDPQIFNIVKTNSLVFSENKLPIIVAADVTNWYINMLPVISLTGVLETAQQLNLQNAGIMTPAYIIGFNSSLMLQQMNLEKDYLIKSYASARSLGKIKVDYATYNDMCYYIADESVTGKDFNAKFNVDVGKCYTEDEHFKLYTALKNVTFYLSEFVNVVEEYRVIFVRGVDTSEYVIEQRYGYCPNSLEERKHAVVDVTPCELIPILTQIKDFGYSTEAPFLSFDVYKDANGAYGVFEYNPIFGTQYPLPIIKKLRKQLTKAMLQAISAHKSKYSTLNIN